MDTTIAAGMEIKNVEKMTVETAGSFGQITSNGTPAQAQINTYDFAASNTAGTIVVNYGSSTSTITTDTTPANNAAAFAAAINAAAGQDITEVSGALVTVTAPTAGTALPSITFGAVTTGAKIPTIAFTQANVANVAASSTDAVYDVSGITGLTDVKVTSAANVNLKAAATTNVDVSGTTGAVKVDGGKDVVVTDAKAAVTLDNAKGNITVTDATQADDIIINDGVNVTVTATSAVDSGVITIGGTNGLNTGNATGDVKVTQNLDSDGVVADITGAAINVVGGKTVDVTVNANSTAKAFNSNNDITTGTVTVTADDKTTDVTVTQNANVTTVTKAEVALVGASQTVTFKDLAAGETVTVNSLVFTAEKDLLAADVAKAFANLTDTDTQSEGGIATNGIYTVAGVTGWTSGAANGATVTFTAAAYDTAGFAVASSAVPSVPTKVYTAGTAFAAEVPSANTVTLGNVVVGDNATKSITTVTVNGATDVTLGGATATASLDALKTLSLANVVGTTTLNTDATSLNMTVNNVATALDATVTVNLDTAITTLNLTSTGDASDLTLVAANVKNLTVDAAAELTITGTGLSSTANSLETVAVKGTAAVNLATIAPSTNLKSFDAAANTGGVTATISADSAASNAVLTTFVFSGGNDEVTLSDNDIDKNINLGAGDDIINLAAGVTDITKNIDGGTGTNTIYMTALQAHTAAASTTFEGKISNFQKLSIGNTSTVATAIDLANMDEINYVISAGTGVAGTLLLDKMANNGTLELTGDTDADGDVTVTMADASGNTDTFNIVTKADAADITLAGDVVVAGVETINITATDSSTDVDNGDTIEEASLILTANLAKTVNVTGSSDVDLTLTGSTLVTLIDATNLTGALTATTAISTAKATIKGGLGNDTLTAAHSQDTLFGNVGADTLIVANGANLVQLHAGEGKDTYQIGTTSNVAAFATINGTASELSGDIIKFGADGSIAIANFNNEKLVLDSGVASYDSYMLAASKATTGEVSYFQWAGNTYLVQDNTVATTDSFVPNADIVVKITGLVDLTFNDTTNVLEIA